LVSLFDRRCGRGYRVSALRYGKIEVSMCALRPDAGIEPGMLLVASPLLRDPNFTRAVIFVIDHRKDGTTGVILNRPSDVQLLDVLPQWWELASGPRRLFVGGPVERNAALCLAQALPGHAPVGWTAISGRVGLADLDSDPDGLQTALSGLRVFAGYAGWGAQQLSDEISEGAWLIVPGRPADVFADPEVDLWSEVLRRQGNRLALIASFPDDPRMN
jgi:putative transcriptional regulator